MMLFCWGKTKISTKDTIELPKNKDKGEIEKPSSDWARGRACLLYFLNTLASKRGIGIFLFNLQRNHDLSISLTSCLHKQLHAYRSIDHKCIYYVILLYLRFKQGRKFIESTIYILHCICLGNNSGSQSWKKSIILLREKLYWIYTM